MAFRSKGIVADRIIIQAIPDIRSGSGPGINPLGVRTDRKSKENSKRCRRRDLPRQFRCTIIVEWPCREWARNKEGIGVWPGGHSKWHKRWLRNHRSYQWDDNTTNNSLDPPLLDCNSPNFVSISDYSVRCCCCCCSASSFGSIFVLLPTRCPQCCPPPP
jgi:hypothetical protein